MIYEKFTNILTTISTRLQSVIDSLASIPSLIYEKFTDILNTISTRLQSVIDVVTSIPSLILDGIREIFIPNTEHIDEIWSNTVETISNKFGFVSYDLGNLFSQSNEIEDIQGQYTFYGLGTLNLTFFDTEFLKQGLAYFRPFIRGFIILLCVFYNIRQALGFFGYSSGEIKSASKGDEK